MKKIIPFFTNIYNVVLYIGPENKFCIAYSANNIFSKNNKPTKQLNDMTKLEFSDMDSANICLATKIYPNIDEMGTVQNATICTDPYEEQEYAQQDGCSFGGSGAQYYFQGTKNLKECYCSFYMGTERLFRDQIKARLLNRPKTK